MKVQDLSNVSTEGPSITLIPPGEYKVIVTDAQEGTSKLKGTPCIELEMEITEGDFKGRGLRDWVYVTEAAMWRVRQCLEAFGFQIPEGEFDFQPAELISKQAGVEVKHRVWNDKEQTEIAHYGPLAPSEVVDVPEPPTGDDGIPF